MKIMQITPGSGDNFYCENCLRDKALIHAMRKNGHDGLVVPLYLPLSIDNTQSGGSTEIFMGGINVYLQQKLRFFRKTPRWLDKLFDSPALLKLAGKFAGTTDAKDLAETTLSMLEGEHGRQKKEIDRLVEWMAHHEQPDIICLSNALLIGLAKPIKQAMNTPVVCFLQDEDEFLDVMPEPYRTEIWDLLKSKLNDIDYFIAPSQYFKNEMQHRLAISDDKIQFIPFGIETQHYASPPEYPTSRSIGFLSRICELKGLDILVDAFIELKKDPQFEDVTLKISGGKTAADDKYIQQQTEKLKQAHLSDEVEWLGEFDLKQRVNFIQSLSVMTVPERRGPAYGLYALESLACGVPLIAPAIGVFKELNQTTQNAVQLMNDNTPAELKAALEQSLTKIDQTRQSGKTGQSHILNQYDIANNSQTLIQTFQRLLNNPA